jgi:uncharacterized membrane protein
MSCDTSRRSSESSLGRAIENTIRLALSTLTVPFLVITDLIIIGNRLGERSATEWGQALLLLVSVVLFAYAAHRRAEARGFYMLVAGFFMCCFIRELDLLLDEWLFHGAWAPLAIAVALLVSARALRVWRTLLPGAVEFVGTQAFIYVQIGLVVVAMLSRSLGSGRQLWFLLGHDDSYRLCKTVIQEALESFGYLLICFGGIILHRELDRGAEAEARGRGTTRRGCAPRASAKHPL